MGTWEREGMLAASLTPAEEAALQELVGAAREILGPELEEIRLFGSRARGEGTPDSDLDVALIVTDAGRERRGEIYDQAFDIGLAHGVSLAPLVIAKETLAMLRDRERRIARDLDREGIPL
jgi:uncharacterized protein